MKGMWAVICMLQVLYCFLFFHKKVKLNLYLFHVLFSKMGLRSCNNLRIRCLVSKKNIDVQHRQILKTQIVKMIKDKIFQTLRIISNFQNEKYPI